MLSMAQTECDKDPLCGGIYDQQCDNRGYFQFCPLLARLGLSTIGSCLYQKTGISISCSIDAYIKTEKFPIR